jgi:hypothetical protein
MTVDPEAPLWTVLDQLGLPFRETRGALVARYGTRPSPWLSGFVECHIAATPLLPGLSDFHFHFGPQASADNDMLVAPDWLCANYRVHSRLGLADRLADRRADRNFADVDAALTARLGPGSPGVSSNTLERSWSFGRARLVARCFPPRLNQGFGPNTRHAADPGSATEASITINPGWLPDLTPDQRGWLAAFRPVGTPDPLPPPGNWLSPPLWHRWPDDLGPAPRSTFGLSEDGIGFVIVSDLGLVRALPRGWLVDVHRSVITPARGSGGTTLSLTVLRSGRNQLPPESIALASGPPGSLGPEAARIAKALSLPLTESLQPDD